MATHRIQPRLHQDTLDLIIDRCGLDDSTLQSLALVCKAFVPEVQKCIFETVELTATEDDARSRRLHSRFYSVISQRPHIAHYVRDFLVRDISGEDDPPENERSSWMRDDPTFLHTLHILARAEVHRFTLETDLYWSSFPNPLKQSFIGLILSPSLRYLGLSGLRSFPRSCCSALRRLEELCLIGVDIFEDDDPDVPVEEVDARSLGWIQIEDVTRSSINILIPSLCPNASVWNSGLAFPALEAIHVGPQSIEEADAACNLIRAARKALKYLHWEYSLRIDLPPAFSVIPLDLSEFERLFWLTFEVSAIETLQDDDYFDGLVALLQTSPPESELGVFHLTVYFSEPEEAQTSLMYHESWDALKEILTPEQFPALTEVRVAICLAEADDDMDDSEEFQALVRGRLEDRDIEVRHNLTVSIDAGL